MRDFSYSEAIPVRPLATILLLAVAAHLLAQQPTPPVCRYGPWEPVELFDVNTEPPVRIGPTDGRITGLTVDDGRALVIGPIFPREGPAPIDDYPREEYRILSNVQRPVALPPDVRHLWGAVPFLRGDTLDLFWREKTTRPEEVEDRVGAPRDALLFSRWTPDRGWSTPLRIPPTDVKAFFLLQQPMLEPGSVWRDGRGRAHLAFWAVGGIAVFAADPDSFRVDWITLAGERFVTAPLGLAGRGDTLAVVFSEDFLGERQGNGRPSLGFFANVSRSFDAGRTWSTPLPVPFTHPRSGGPGASVQGVGIALGPGGRLWVASRGKGAGMGSTPLAISWSDDGGATWAEPHVVPPFASPPNLVADECGTVHVAFTATDAVEDPQMLADPRAVVLRWDGTADPVADTLPREPDGVRPLLATDGDWIYVLYWVWDAQDGTNLDKISHHLYRRRVIRERR
ncbi:MAG: hypothetical protein D6701_08435 [Gemmatimonadetes bacterium]|nr:MAG: hypothetical protein D6701_08435 [Gemmatimonadota bacterium]